MALTRLQNIISSVEGRIIYVNPDDFDSTDAIDNKGNSPIRPFRTIARAVLEVAKYSYVSAGNADDKFDQFTIMLYPGDHIVDNRPGSYAYNVDGATIVPNVDTQFTELASEGNLGWSNSTKQYGDLFRITNSTRGGLIIPRGVSIIGLDLRKTKVRPKYIPGGGNNTAPQSLTLNFDADITNRTQLTINSATGGDKGDINDVYVGSVFKNGLVNANNDVLISPGTTITSFESTLGGTQFIANISKPHAFAVTTTGTQAELDLPFEDDNTRSAVFRITGGCYFWQFSIFDGDPTGVYNASPVIPKDHGTAWSEGTVAPFYSHTKLTIFEYASLHDLHVFYRKVADAILTVLPDKIEPMIQENRIVGPLSDEVQILKVTRNATVVTVTLAQELNLTAGNFVSIGGQGVNIITGSSNTNGYYIGEKRVSSVISRSEFTYILTPSDVQALDVYETSEDQDAVQGGTQIVYCTAALVETPEDNVTISQSAKAEIEIDTVESASPYIFNISLRSTQGSCGMHADGSRATGFKSMVVAQYTGISLQKNDSAFVKYDSSIPQYISAGSGGHKDINAIYEPTSRSYHVKASNRAVIQAVSVFAVGYADHFIAEDGGDMSITNSNSNFGSNSMRSIGFSDLAFKKDSLGEITHIIPPRNIESVPSNVYWESIDTVLTQSEANNTRLYLEERTQELLISAFGSGFSVGSYDAFFNGEDTGKTINVTAVGTGADAGKVTAATFDQGDYGNLQPGDKVTINSPATGGLPAEITFGGSLTSFAGEYKVGENTIDQDGVAKEDLLYVPLFPTGSSTQQVIQTSRIDKENTTGKVFEYDYANSNWYLRVKSAFNDIYSIISTNTTKYGALKIESTPTSYISRIVDDRIDDDKIYRLRYVTRRDATGTTPSFPQAGYVIQPKKGKVDGVGDRFTDAANLLLLNKEVMATDLVSRYKSFEGTSSTPPLQTSAGTTSCEEDIIRIIETVAYDLRYGGNSRSYDGAALYTSGTGATGITGERSETVLMINAVSSQNGGSDNFDGLKMMFNHVINNGVVGTNPAGGPTGTENGVAVGAKVWGDSPNSLTPEYIVGQPQLINVEFGCTNVLSAADTLLNIYTTALGSDSSPGTIGALPARTTSSTAFPSESKVVNGPTFNFYERISGQEFNDVYYIYEVEEEQAFSYNESTEVETPGIYYLTVLKGSVYINGSKSQSQSVLPGNTFRFSQETTDLYPKIDLDNIVNDPIIAKSIADPEVIGRVNTQDGTDSNFNASVNKEFSITKESLAYLLDEYLTNEIEWDWDGVGDNSIVHSRIPNSTSGGSGAVLTSMASKSGSSEVRKIDINPNENGWKILVELRRPSTIRSGNHTFEYVGFGPGNYSTAFPIKQTKVLTPEQQKYSQSLKEAGGIAFYSGLNSNGDLYIGNTVINAVSGKTTENQINELTSLTIKNNLNVLGGTGNSIASNFQGPVNFIGNINADGGKYIFSNLQLRNTAGFTTKFTNGSTATLPSTAIPSDIQWNLNPVDGGSAGHVYTEGTLEWRPFGLIGTESIHSYKHPSVNGQNQQTLQVGGDYDAAAYDSQTSYNYRYNFDVTESARIGSRMSIGTSTSYNGEFELTSNTVSGRKTKLHISNDWSAEPNHPKKTGLLLSVTSNSGETIDGINTRKYIDCLNVSEDSVFSVDEGGNVEIPSTANYGLASKAWSVTLTVVGTGATNTEDTISFGNLTTNFFTVNNVSIDQFQGSTPDGTFIPGDSGLPGQSFVWQSETPLDSKTFYGAPGQLSAYAGKSNSVMIFINGVMQDPFLDSHLATNNRLYLTSSPQVGDIITIRGFAS